MISLFNCPSCPRKKEENASFFCTCGRSCMGRPAMTLTSSLFHGQDQGPWQSFHLKAEPVQQPTRLCLTTLLPSKARNCGTQCPHNLNNIQNLEHFKDQLTKFLLSFPDMPPIRGCSPPNSNSLLSWRIERGYTSLWGGRNC